MSGTISPELNVGFKHISFDNQLKQRYGVNFLASYYASPLVRILENDQNSPDLPYFSELKPMLRNATGYRFVEWKTDKGTVDWKYVVTSSEDRPAGDGKYLCHKVFRYDKDKQWIQEATQIDTQNPLPMRDCTAGAIKPALVTAIQDRFGLPFFTEFIQAGYVSGGNIINLPLGSQLLKLIPKDARVRYTETQ